MTQTFIWNGKGRKQWRLWNNFHDFLELIERIEGPIVNEDWLQDEVSVVGELGFFTKFIEMRKSGKKYGNPQSSSLAYFMGITDIPPYGPVKGLKVSQQRYTYADIDLDFEDRYRDRAFDYTRQKYGKERTAQIATFGEIGAKKAVRDVARVLDKPYELGDKLSKAMPPAVFGVAPSLDDCMKSPEFRELYETDEEVKEIVDTARQIEGLWRNTGIHAAGFLVADAPITDYVPIMQFGEDNPIVTQWDMRRTEECGLLKIDFLSLRNLTIVSKCVKNIQETQGIDIGDPFKLVDIQDPEVYESLRKGRNIGVFQMESAGFKELMTALKPSELNDLSAMLALYRPGPMGSNVHKEYAARKNGLKPVRYFHPSLEPILKNTYGLLLYQEQLLEIAKQVAGKDTFEADELRIIVGKKKIDKMPAQRASFVAGCVETVGMRAADAEQLFNEIEHHASYSFNESHSLSYAFLSYVTAYLKVKYPIEYMAAMLSSVGDNDDRMRLYLNESKEINIPVKHPSVNYAVEDFSIQNNAIVYGLDGVKGFGQSNVSSIIKSRSENEPYRNLFDFLRRASADVLNRKILLIMIKSGMLDEILTMEDFEADITRYEKIQLLLEEAGCLGVFLDQHPFQDLKYLTLDKTSHSIGEALRAPIGSFVNVAGLVTTVEKKTTKAGKRMYILNVEDDESSIEMIAFPNFAETLSEKPFKKGDLLVVAGKVNQPIIPGKEDEETQKSNLIISKMENIDYSIIGTEPPIYLRAEKEVDVSRLEKIAGIIKATNGSSPVYLEMVLNSGKTIVVKFDKTTSLQNEGILRKLIEV